MVGHSEDAFPAPLHTAGSAEWRRLLDRECASSPQLFRYASDPREGDCVRLLSGLQRRRALFLGNALAILPTILAGLFESVVVADSNSRRLALAEQRRDEDGIENLGCVPTTGTNDVPGSLGQFDLVVLGEERPDTAWSLPFADSDAPRRLATAIVPGGSLMYGVRFPRLAGLAGTVASPWSGGTAMSYPAHARMLAAAGFSAVEAYGRRPHTRPYQVYIPLDNPELLGYWIGSGPRRAGVRTRLSEAVKRALVRLDAPHFLFNNLLVIARRG